MEIKSVKFDWKLRLVGYALVGVIIASAVIFKDTFRSRPVEAQTTAGQSLLDEVLQRGQVRVATTTGSPPFAFIDAKGNLVGFDIDVARLLAKSLFNDPNKVNFVRTSFDGRWTTVNSGQADFGIMITTIQPARALHVAF